MKLSIGMMVKNEEKNLERCLESLRPLMEAVSSELIIVDTGSTDTTVDIAKRYTDKVYYHPWENHYSNMRNRTLSYAKGEWFMFIDADEEIVTHMPIVEFLNSNKARKYNAATVEIKSFYTSTSEDDFSVMSGLRLAKRTKDFHFEGVIHEQPKFDMPFYITEALLNHYGYVGDDPELNERKLNIYEPILLKAVEEEPDNIYYWYQLSRTYASYTSPQAGIESGEKAFEKIKENKLHPSDYTFVYTNLANLYISIGRSERAIELAKEALGFDHELVDLWYYLAKAQINIKKYDDAIDSIQNYLQYAKNYIGNKDKDIRVMCYTLPYVDDALHDLAVLYKEIGQNGEAIKMLQKIRPDRMNKKTVSYIIELALSGSDMGVLITFHDKLKLIKDERLGNYFYQVLEEMMIGYPDLESEVHQIFKDEKTDYGFLNKIRLLEDGGILNGENIDLIEKLDFNGLDSYYGDIIYYLLKSKNFICFESLKIYGDKLEEILMYIRRKRKDALAVFQEYMESQSSQDSLHRLRNKKIIGRYIVLDDTLNEEKHREALENYIKAGRLYIERLYSKDLDLPNGAYLLKDREDIFITYMAMAFDAKPKDKAVYIRCLNLALKANPSMKKLIERLIDEVTKEAEEEKPSIDNEMAAYAAVVKRNLRQLIDQKLYVEALEIIEAFDEILPGDKDVERLRKEIKSKQN